MATRQKAAAKKPSQKPSLKPNKKSAPKPAPQKSSPQKPAPKTGQKPRHNVRPSNGSNGAAPTKSPPAPVKAQQVTAKKEKTVIQKTVVKKLDFRANEFVVYPAHGVGKIERIEEQEVAGIKLELFVVAFEKDKMTLRVPTGKAKAVGLRRLSSPDIVKNALKTLKGRARIKRTMWSRRAQEYEAKINSGDLISIAEVVRDLHRGGDQPEQSYSERQLYEAALDRFARELAAVEKIDEQAALKQVEIALVRAVAA